MLKAKHSYQVVVPCTAEEMSEPLYIPTAEPGDALAVSLTAILPEMTALGYAAVLTFGHSALALNGQPGGYLLTAPLYPGSTLYLPVYLPGAGLILGNPLLRPEVTISSCQAELAVAIFSDFPLQRPRLENDFSWFFFASHLETQQALALAWQDLLGFVQHSNLCSGEKAKQLALDVVQAYFHLNPTDPGSTACLILPKTALNRF